MTEDGADPATLPPPVPGRPEQDEGRLGVTAVRTSSAGLLRGGAWTALAYVLPQAYLLVLSIVAARYLGPADMGRQSYIAFVAISATRLCTAGIPVALMRYIAEALGAGRAAATRGLLSWAWRVVLIGAAVGGAGLVITGFLSMPHTRGGWWLAALVTVFSILQTIPTAVLIALQRFRANAWVGIVTGVIGVGASWLVLALNGGITGLFAVEAAVAAANLTWTGQLARRALAGVSTHREDPGDLPRKVLRFAGPASLGIVLDIVIYKRSEFFFLKAWSTDEQIAVYSIAFAVVAAATRMPSAITAVVAPAVANLTGSGELDRIRRGYRRAMRLMTLLTVPLTAGMLALAPLALPLVYGHAYSKTSEVVVLLLLGFPLQPLATTAAATFYGLGTQRPVLVWGGVAAVVSITLDALLIGPYGAVGAAIGNVAGQVAAAVPILIAIERRLDGVRWLDRTLVRTVIASALDGVLTWFVSDALGGWAGLGVGAVVAVVGYLTLARLLRVLPAEDASWLTASIGLRFGGRSAAFLRNCSRETAP